jgi:hypothetical protein
VEFDSFEAAQGVLMPNCSEYWQPNETGEPGDLDPFAELLTELGVAEDRIGDLVWERDTAYAELEALQQRAERHDALVDALVKFIRELDVGQWASQWPLRARMAFETVCQLPGTRSQ